MMEQNRREVSVIRLPHARDLPLPAYATEGSAGLDLLAAVPQDQPVILEPGARALIPTGIALALPPDLEGQVRPRSGLAVRDGLTVLNSPGTIDPDFRGEIQIILVNLGGDKVKIDRGERIAQIILSKFTYVQLTEVAVLDDTQRGTGGFGSTGM